MWLLITTYIGCSACNDPYPPPAPRPAAAAHAKAKAAKAKAARAAKAPPPVGAAGAVVGSLLLEAVAGDADEAAAPASRTTASLILTFGEAEEARVSLGEVDGPCDQREPVPVGPEGKQHTPLWSVICGEGETRTELYILQIGDAVSVVREMPPTNPGDPTKWVPVKRVPLAKGAILERGS